MDLDSQRALITATEGKVARAWLAMVQHLREANTEAGVAARLNTGEPLADVTDAADRLALAFHAAHVDVAQKTARWLGDQIQAHRKSVRKALPVYDPSNPAAVQQAQQSRLDLIRDINTETRVMIRDALMEGARTGAAPSVVAREIRDSIGLTTHQVGIVDNYRRQLEQGQFAAALRRQLSSGHSDKTIAAAMARQQAMSRSQIDTAVSRYRDNMVTARATTIARTEGGRIAHQAQEAMFGQAIARGDLHHSQLQRAWVHGQPGKGGTKDERWFHRSMDKQTVGMGELFTSGLGNQLRYPHDPHADPEETINCRCTVVTRVIPPPPGFGAIPEPAGVGQAADLIADTADGAAESDAAATPDEETGLNAEAAAEAAPVEAAPSSPDMAAPDALDGAGQSIGEAPAESDIADPEIADALRELADRRAAHASARAELERATAAHDQAAQDLAAAEQQVDGFRIGVSSEIAGDEAGGLAPIEAPIETSELASPSEPGIATPPAVAEEVAIPAIPAPLGFEAIDVGGETRFRQLVNGRVYTADQMATREQPFYSIVLGPPNEQVPGFQTVEIKSPGAAGPDILYRGASGRTWRPDDIASGEAQESEQWLQEQHAVDAASPKPGRLRRILGRLFGGG